MKHLTRKQRGLGKYDAPLKFQFEKGYTDFKHGRVFNPFHKDTMQHREWLRGFNKAYFEQLKKVRRRAIVLYQTELGKEADLSDVSAVRQITKVAQTIR